MSTLDRRAFVVGGLAVALAGCIHQGSPQSLSPASASLRPNLSTSPPAVYFRNNGGWINEGNQSGDEWVYVVAP
jgi:hypothetical protein